MDLRRETARSKRKMCALSRHRRRILSRWRSADGHPLPRGGPAAPIARCAGNTRRPCRLRCSPAIRPPIGSRRSRELPRSRLCLARRGYSSADRFYRLGSGRPAVRTFLVCKLRFSLKGLIRGTPHHRRMPRNTDRISPLRLRCVGRRKVGAGTPRRNGYGGREPCTIAAGVSTWCRSPSLQVNGANTARLWG